MDRATQMFPLYSFNSSLLSSRESNISKAMSCGKNDESVFYYIYAILHCPAYRTKYGSALRDSYPRIPSVSAMSESLFDELVRLGGKLVALHLMESPDLNHPMT